MSDLGGRWLCGGLPLLVRPVRSHKVWFACCESYDKHATYTKPWFEIV
jgi:hypothetical protein